MSKQSFDKAALGPGRVGGQGGRRDGIPIRDEVDALIAIKAEKELLKRTRDEDREFGREAAAKRRITLPKLKFLG